MSRPVTSAKLATNEGASTTKLEDHAAKPSKFGKRAARISIACSSCKKRRTKCSGGPGPCATCVKTGTFCHFDPKLDTRRKISRQSGDIHTRVKFILNSLLLALKFNPSESVHEFLLLLRRRDLSIWDLAKCLQHHFEILQQKGLIPPNQLDVDDLLSLALANLASARWTRDEALLAEGHIEVTISPTREESFDTMHSRYPGALQEELSGQSGRPQSLSGYSSLSSFLGPDDLDPRISEPSDGIDDEQDVLVGSSQQEDGIALFRSPGDAMQSVLQPSNQPGLVEGTDMSAFSLDSQILVPSNASPNWNERYVHDIPLIEPHSELGRLCFGLRNNGRLALADGVRLDRLTYWGRMDCDLLFRDRTPNDEWNIPNWACEVARRLPPMTPSTRIACALCIARIMPYLITPSDLTWSQLPELLRPTVLQMQIPHDITYSLVPIPALRDRLVQRPADWLSVLLPFNFALQWSGDWGDIGGATLSNTGNWNYGPGASYTNIASMHGAESGVAKAILFDASTGRSYLSEDFQRCCWDLANWSVRMEILTI